MQPQAELKHSLLLAVQRPLCMQVRLQGPRLLSSASPDSVVKYLIGALLRKQAAAVTEDHATVEWPVALKRNSKSAGE